MKKKIITFALSFISGIIVCATLLPLSKNDPQRMDNHIFLNILVPVVCTFLGLFHSIDIVLKEYKCSHTIKPGLLLGSLITGSYFTILYKWKDIFFILSMAGYIATLFFCTFVLSYEKRQKELEQNL